MHEDYEDHQTIEPNQIVQRFQDTSQSSRLHIINITTDKELVVGFTLGTGQSTACHFPREYLKKLTSRNPFFLQFYLQCLCL